ncbi:hypothetical protein JGX56_004449 [Salmonella enterica]|nr:hypothetical protein [Salmonella enterica]
MIATTGTGNDFTKIFINIEISRACRPVLVRSAGKYLALFAVIVMSGDAAIAPTDCAYMRFFLAGGVDAVCNKKAATGGCVVTEG